MSASIVIRSVAGPDAGWAVRLTAGVHWLGRVPGGIEVHDPAIEAHHALVRIDERGRAGVLQTSGRVPVRIDGEPVAGWVRVPTGATLEVGHSLLQVGSTVALPTGSSWVYAPLDDGSPELERFTRDAVVAAAVARRSTRRTATSVVLGLGASVTPIEVRDRDGVPVSVGGVGDAAHAALLGATTSPSPLEIDLADHPCLAVVAPDPRSVADALTTQLSGRARARLVVVPAGDASRFGGRTVVVLADAVDDVPAWCRSLLEVGETWRAVWTPDLDRPDRFVRLHARGRSQHRAAAAERADVSPERAPDRRGDRSHPAGDSCELFGADRLPIGVRRSGEGGDPDPCRPPHHPGSAASPCRCRDDHTAG